MVDRFSSPIVWTSTKGGQGTVAELQTHVNEIVGKQQPSVSELQTHVNVNEIGKQQAPVSGLEWKVSVSEQVMSSLINMSDDRKNEFYALLNKIVRNPETAGAPLEDEEDQLEGEL